MTLPARTLVLGAVLATAACAPFATYPPIETHGLLANPMHEPVPTIIAEGLRYARDRWWGADTMIFNLPEGLPPELYGEVAARLGDATPMTGSEQIAFHVISLRTRGAEAELDLIRPASDRHELVTLFFHRTPFATHRVAGLRAWRLPAEPDPPHYVPAAIVTDPGPEDESPATLDESASANGADTAP